MSGIPANFGPGLNLSQGSGGSALARIRDSDEQLGALVGELESRLGPILTAPQPEPAEDGKSLCEIDEIARRLQYRVQRLGGILHRIAL